MEILLYALVFIFGIQTHRTFANYNNAKMSILLLQSAQMTSLLILVKCVQSYSYVKNFGCNQLIKNGASEDEVDNYIKFIDNDIEFFKKTSVSQIIKDTPSHFSAITAFSDWESAMAYLDKLNNIRKFHDQEN
jgi:hypothetical protein